MKVQSVGGGMIKLRCIGQSVGSESELRAQLGPMLKMDKPSSALSIQSLSFLKAVQHFAGPLDYESVYMKAKSDYALTPLTTSAITAMMAAASQASTVALLCDGYGGRIADIAATDTAFPRRAGTQFCIQYYSSWTKASDTASHVASVAKVYAAMRPFMRVLCELLRPLPDYANAYWGDNLPRLMSVKAEYDRQNPFRHAQSVPLPPPPQV
jgi:hypothetical protein